MLLEEEPQPHRNEALEASLRSRIRALENANSFFLPGTGWDAVKEGLEACTSQSQYETQLRFETMDLKVREQRHSCYNFWQQMLSAHPSLAQRAAYAPEEAAKDFFNQSRDSLDRFYNLQLGGEDGR